MIISPVARLWLYIGMSILPVWIDFFKLSTDYSLRGLAMPILTSLNAGVIVALAKTMAASEKTTTTATASADGTAAVKTVTENPTTKSPKK